MSESVYMHTKIYVQENPYWKSDCFSNVESYHHKTCSVYGSSKAMQCIGNDLDRKGLSCTIK